MSSGLEAAPTYPSRPVSSASLIIASDLRSAAPLQRLELLVQRSAGFGVLSSCTRNAHVRDTLTDGWTLTRSIHKRGGNRFEFLRRAFRDLEIDIIPSLESVTL